MQQIIKWFVDKFALQAVTLLAQWLGKYLPYILEEWKRKKERQMAQEEAKKVYDQKQADPNLSIEDKFKAHEEYQNAGRK